MFWYGIQISYKNVLVYRNSGPSVIPPITKPHMKLADFSFVNPWTIWDLRRLQVVSVLCPLIFLLVCSLMQPPPAHPDTAADILCQKWKIAPARDGKIRKDCHDMHVVFWVKTGGTKSLKEFLLSAFIELNSPVVFESGKEFFYASRNVTHIVQHHQNTHHTYFIVMKI